MTVRPLLPNQSGTQPGWPMSHVPDLLFSGALPRSVKNDEPGSPLPFSVMPQSARDAWMASKTRVLDESFWYMYVSVRPFGWPPLVSAALHSATLPAPLSSLYGL